MRVPGGVATGSLPVVGGVLRPTIGASLERGREHPSPTGKAARRYEGACARFDCPV